MRAFNRFYTNIIGVVDRHVLGSPFSLTEARILLEISRRESCHARAIKAVLNVDEGYLSRTIDKLVKQGLVTKSRSREDARVFTLSLTPRGRTTFRELSNQSGAAISRMLDGLSGAEVDELVAHMSRIEELLTKAGDRHDTDP